MQAIRAVIERELGTRVSSIRATSGGDINDAFRMDTAGGPIFVKTSRLATPGTYRSEADGLAWLGAAGALPVPEVLVVHDPPAAAGDDSDLAIGSAPRFLAMRWIDAGPASPDSDAALGAGLAKVHQAGAASFGCDEPMRLADLELPNEPFDMFAEFYAACRILPLAEASHARGRLSADGVALMHKLCERMPALAGPPEPPARTHGDLWSGNVLVDSAGRPHLIDPVAHGGHREVDLATLRLFGGPSQRAFDAYAEVSPLADGATDRISLFQLNTILIHVALFGGAYEQQAIAIARRYV